MAVEREGIGVVVDEDLLIGLGPHRDRRVLCSGRKRRHVVGAQGQAEGVHGHHDHVAREIRSLPWPCNEQIAIRAALRNNHASRRPNPQQPGDPLPMPRKVKGHLLSRIAIEFRGECVGDLGGCIDDRRSGQLHPPVGSEIGHVGLGGVGARKNSGPDVGGR